MTIQLNDNFTKVFEPIPILGMLHLAGDDPVRRALEEIAIFETEGVDGAIVENYHGTVQHVRDVLRELRRRESDLVIGVNILSNEFGQSLRLAREYGAAFVQLDHVAGTYDKGELDAIGYELVKDQYPEIVVLGGVWPKYYTPVDWSDLETDLRTGMRRAEAIVVTGKGTGKETPLDKIQKFREVLGDHPLIVGAGLTPDNAYKTLCIADGAIVGTSLKEKGCTENPVDKQRVRDFMTVVHEARVYRRLLVE